LSILHIKTSVYVIYLPLISFVVFNCFQMCVCHVDVDDVVYLLTYMTVK